MLDEVEEAEMISVYVRAIVTRSIICIGTYSTIDAAMVVAKRFRSAGWMTWIA